MNYKRLNKFCFGHKRNWKNSRNNIKSIRKQQKRSTITFQTKATMAANSSAVASSMVGHQPELKELGSSTVSSSVVATPTSSSFYSSQQQNASSVTSAAILTQQQNDLKKLVEYLLSDLRNLSTEAKKKHNHVKEAAESGIVKVRNISSGSASEQLLENVRAGCAEIIHPLILGCSSKNPRLVQISLQAIQRMLQYRVIDANSSSVIVNELWQLTEAGCEELRVLQTVTPFVSTELLVTDWALAKCIVLAIKLNFSKDASVINAASAAVRQLFSCVFERVVQEDGMKSGELTIDKRIMKESISNQKLAPPTLRPMAADGYLLLKDLTLLIRKENPIWLSGVNRITMTLALELLEGVLKNYPSIFYKHAEYVELLRNHICPQLMKLLIGEKQLRISSQQESTESLNSNGLQHDVLAVPTRPIFPILMRSLRIALVLLTNYHSLLVTHVEVIFGFLIELTYTEGFPWQTAMALEIFHKVLAQPNFLFWLCQNYERQTNATKLIRLILQSIISFIRKFLDDASSCNSLSEGSQYFGQSGFQYKGTFIPLHENLSQRRWIFFRLDWLEKHEPGVVPDGYCLSVAYMCLVDCTNSIYAAVEDCRRMQHAATAGTETTNATILPDGNMDANSAEIISKELFLSSYRYLLDGLSTLLEYSADESISDSILSCISTHILLACRFSSQNDNTNNLNGGGGESAAEAKDLLLKTLCTAVLPSNYFEKFIESCTPANMNNQNSANELVSNTSYTSSLKDTLSNAAVLSHVVAMGTICPIPSLPSSMYNTNVMLTSKSMQVSRVLLACALQNGHYITDSWDMILATLQHLIWILGMKPTSAGTFRAGGDTTSGSSGTTTVLANGTIAGSVSGGMASVSSNVSASASTGGNVILTTMVSSELPDLNLSLNRLFESTATFDDVSLHHVIAALCKLSSEAMMVAQTTSREPSFFAVAKLLQTSVVNLPRLVVFWKPVTAHLLEICAHTNSNLRDWGTVALSSLVKSGFKQILSDYKNDDQKDDMKLSKNELLILSPLASMSEVDYTDVKTRQLDCLMHILQSDSQHLCPKIWPLIIEIVNAIVFNCTNAQLIEQGYRTLSLMVKEFLNIMPFECVRMLVETDARYGKQQADLNVSLSAVGQLWDISDYVRRETGSAQRDSAEVEQVWLVLYASLGKLCVDARPPVRKSACDTLLQTVAAYGHALGAYTWREMVGTILFPILDQVQNLTRNASTVPTNTSAFGASNIMIHHSRNTDAKQWAETTVKTLSGVVKIFNSQRSILISLDCFSDYWARLLAYIEAVVATGNSEMSLAALKNFQELLFGRQQQASDIREKQQCLVEDPTLLQLPEKLWMVSWKFWLRIARQISFPYIRRNDEKSFGNQEKTIEAEAGSQLIDDLQFQASLRMKSYVPGPFHLTTLLNVFILLFNRIGRQISIADFRGELNVPEIFKDISSIPVSVDQAPFVLNSENAELSVSQECLLDCIQAIVQEQLDAGSRISAAIPDMLRLLLEFVSYSVHPPLTKFQTGQSASISTNNSNGNNSPENQFQWSKQNLISFAELSLRTAVDYYSKVSNYPEIIEHAILVDIVKRLHEPLSLKYNCPNQSTWKLAATSLIEVCRIGLPIARDNSDRFVELWPELADTIDGFLFSTSKPAVRLNADERKRHEFVDCLMVELIRTDILPYAELLPWDFMQRIVDILNRGSINTMDPNDVMDSFQHRADLSRVCFDALLSISRNETKKVMGESSDLLKTTFSRTASSSTAFTASGGAVKQKSSVHEHRHDSLPASTSLGATAIMSLLSRCKQVLNNYARDEQNSGHFRLPQERIFETISVLKAVSSLIDGFSKYAEDAHSTLYTSLVALYPDLVQMIPSCRSDQQLELALMTALNSYQTLLLINIHKF